MSRVYRVWRRFSAWEYNRHAVILTYLVLWLLCFFVLGLVGSTSGGSGMCQADCCVGVCCSHCTTCIFGLCPDVLVAQ